MKKLATSLFVVYLILMLSQNAASGPGNNTSVVRSGKVTELLHANQLDDKTRPSVASAGDASLLKGLDKMFSIRAGNLGEPAP